MISELTFIRCTSADKPVQENIEVQAPVVTETPVRPIEDEKKSVEKTVDFDGMISQMTLEQKIAQMIMPSIYKRPNSYEAAVTKIKPYISDAIKKYNFGGIILFKANTNTSAQT
ncbi:MAG: hypothetical protein II716_08370, partial [Treponema sp.]|nr:hypothetical protein [Treponema sp.]